MDNKDNNKSAWTEPFYKERNIGKCLSLGVSLISNRFFKIFRLASPVIAFAAVVFTFVTFTFCNAEYEYDFADSALFRAFAAVIILIAVAALAAFAYRCVDVNIEGLNIFSIGFKYTYNKEFWRKTIVAMIIGVLTLIVALAFITLAQVTVNFFSVTPGQNGISILAVIIYGLAVGMATVLTIPLYMSLNRMMIDKKNLYNDFKQGYILGWKKWGRIFALDLLINLIMAVMAVFILSPAYVTSLMMHSATLSKLQGDAVDIPAYFNLITICVIFFSSVIWSIFIIARYLPHAYFYANVVTEDKEFDNNVNKK